MSSRTDSKNNGPRKIPKVVGKRTVVWGCWTKQVQGTRTNYGRPIKLTICSNAATSGRTINRKLERSLGLERLLSVRVGFLIDELGQEPQSQ